MHHAFSVIRGQVCVGAYFGGMATMRSLYIYIIVYNILDLIYGQVCVGAYFGGMATMRSLYIYIYNCV